MKITGKLDARYALEEEFSEEKLLGLYRISALKDLSLRYGIVIFDPNNISRSSSLLSSRAVHHVLEL